MFWSRGSWMKKGTDYFVATLKKSYKFNRLVIFLRKNYSAVIQTEGKN